MSAGAGGLGRTLAQQAEPQRKWKQAQLESTTYEVQEQLQLEQQHMQRRQQQLLFPSLFFSLQLMLKTMSVV